jgi:hypothetical protein
VAWGSIINPQYEREKDNTQFYTLIVCSKRECDLMDHGDQFQRFLHRLIEAGNARYVYSDEGKPVLRDANSDSPLA